VTELPSPNPQVVARRLGDQVVLVHLGTNRILALNPTGARFWELLAEGRSRGEIEEQLRQEYDVRDTQLAQEINELLDALGAEDLVRWP
jgi:hypothetical protein